MKIIGVAGPARSGKDTVGDYLVEECNFVRLAFASPMKHMISTLLNASVDWIEHEDNKEYPVPGLNHSPRELLQTLGTEWGRNTLEKDFWVNIVWRQVDALIVSDHCPGIVITDVRFENEADRIRQSGGIIAHISRRDAPQIAEHVSEAGVHMKGCDCKLYNDDTIPDLYRAVDAMRKMYPKLVRLGGHV